jgi:hypothetical protein
LEEIIRELAEREKPGAASPAPAVMSATTVSYVPNGSPVLAPAAGFDVSDSTAATRPSAASVHSSPPSASQIVSQQSLNAAMAMVPNGGSQSKSFSSHHGSIRQPTFRKTSTLQMPEPKTMGIAGGVVAAAVLGAAFWFGWISSPFGMSGGALPGNAGAVVSCYLEYKQFGTAVASGEEWEAFCLSVESKVKPVVESSADAKDNVTEAGRKLMELAALEPEENLESLQKISGELDGLMPEIVGTN